MVVRRGCGRVSGWVLPGCLIATVCPPIHTSSFDFRPLTIAGSPATDDAPVVYCPRRTVLDKLLVDAAAEAGADVLEGFHLDELLMEDGRVVGIKGHGEYGSRRSARAPLGGRRGGRKSPL